MKRSDPTRLTEPRLLRAVVERSPKPVAYKTLCELEALGRPPRPAVERVCEGLIDAGYLFPAVAANGNGVSVVKNGQAAKEHSGLWALLISGYLAAAPTTQSAEAAGAKAQLRQLVNTSIFLKRTAREARCAWTRADHDLYEQLTGELDRWIAKEWETLPTWVARRRRSIETVCHCPDCREFGDNVRRREEMRRKMLDADPEAKTDAAERTDELMTAEMEAEVKSVLTLQTDVEALREQVARLETRTQPRTEDAT